MKDKGISNVDTRLGEENEGDRVKNLSKFILKMQKI